MSFRITPRTGPWIGWLTCFALVFVSAFFLSGARQSPLELDPSWHAALEYATAHHLQFGTEIVFTFGPLGFLSTRTSLGHLIGARIVFAFFWSTVIAIVATGLARRLPGWVRYAFLAWLIVFTLSEGIDQTAFFVMAYGTLVLLSDDPKRRWQMPTFVFAFVVLSLIKITFLAAAVASLALVLVCWIWQRKFVSTVVLSLATPIGFLAFWMALGQAPSHLIPWLRHAWELTAGYSAAMNLPPKMSVLCFALAALALFAGAWVPSMVRLSVDFLVWARALAVAEYVALAWKEGFTRSGDWHVFVFLWFLPLGVTLLLLVELPRRPTVSHRTALDITIAASILLCLIAASLQIPGFVRRQVTECPARIGRNAKSIAATLGGRGDTLYAQCRDSQNLGMLQLDRAKAVIGDESVDVMNYLSLAPLVNGMNYRPRPVFQGFVAYTPALQDLNAAYFASERRPHFVLLSPDATDGRFPALEDSAALNYVLNNYVPVARDGRFLVLQERTMVDPVFQLVHEQTLHFGENLDLSRWSADPLFMSVSLQPSLLGRAAALVYQPQPLFMGVAIGDARKAYRVVPSMAVQPFLVNPLLNANHDVLGFYASIQGRHTTSVVFERPHHGSFEFRDGFTVRLYTSPGFPNAVKGISADNILADVQGRVFVSPPKFKSSACGTKVVMFHGSPAWLMCAPSKIVLEVPSNASSFSGFFGVPGRLYPEDPTIRSRVNVAIATCEQSGECRRAFDRSLVPPPGGGDSDKFTFRIPIDSSQDRFIELSTESAAANSQPSLAVWSQCRFEKTSVH